MQEVVVYIVGVAAAAWIVVAVWRTVRRRRNPCSGCPSCGKCSYKSDHNGSAGSR